MTQVLYRTYRPSTFEEVRGQEHVVRTVQNQFASGRLAHAFLFTGPRGVGKTTMARLLAKLANCASPKNGEPCNACEACASIASGRALDVYEIDAASHTGVDNVRETVIDSVRFAPNALKKKVYIIDEVHMLSTSAFNALLKTLEEPPEHVLFVLATTEIHKVPETIISRCQRFDFRRLSEGELVARMEGIAKAEGVKVDEVVLREIARHSAGCARDAESLLSQVLALGEKRIGMEEASLVLPLTQTMLIEEFVDSLMHKRAAQAVSQLNEYLEQGVDLRRFVEDTVSWLRDRLLEAVSGKTATHDAPALRGAIEELMRAQGEIRDSRIPQLPVELAIVKLCGMVVEQDFQTQEVDSDRSASTGESDPTHPSSLRGDASVESTKQSHKTASRHASLAAKGLVARNDEESLVVFDSVPVISLEDVKTKWPEVYEQIKSCNASLPMMMKSCEVCGVEGEHVELGFEYGMYVETINQEKNRRLIEGVFERVLGRRLRVKAVQKKTVVEQDESVQRLLAEFGGSVA